MAQKIIQMQMRHSYFNLKDLFSNRKGFVILTSLLRFKNKSREFRGGGEADFKQNFERWNHQFALDVIKKKKKDDRDHTTYFIDYLSIIKSSLNKQL